MPKLPVLSGKLLIRALEKAGFWVVRQSGSHVLLKNARNLITSIPVHGNSDLPPGTLRAILRDAEITIAELLELL